MKVLWKSGIYGYTNGSAAAPENCPKYRTSPEKCIKIKNDSEKKADPSQHSAELDQEWVDLSDDLADFAKTMHHINLDPPYVAVFQSAEELSGLIEGNKKSRMAG